MTYDYLCKFCAHEWEEDQKITENPIEICPACGKKEAQRQISKGTSFILNGGGWASSNYS